MRKTIACFISTAVLAGAFTITAFAGTWQKDNTGWYYQNDDGNKVMNTAMWIDGNNDGVSECYYFNENGYLLVNTTAPDGNEVNENGAWVVNGAVQTQTAQVQQAQTKIVPTQGWYRIIGQQVSPYADYYLGMDDGNPDLLYVMGAGIDTEYATFVRHSADPALFTYDAYYYRSDENYENGWINYRTDDKITNLCYDVTGYIKVIDDRKVNINVNAVPIEGTNSGALLFSGYNGIHGITE